MDNFRFKHIGQTDSSSFSFPDKRTSQSDTARTGPSLLDRISQSEKTHTESSNVKRTDTAQYPSKSPKTARQPKRVRPEASLADRISAPDVPALLNRISAPDVQTHRLESRVSPHNKQGSSSGSEPTNSPGTESPHATAPLQPPILENAATPAVLPNLLSQTSSDVDQPPGPAAAQVTRTAPDTVTQTSLTTKLLETPTESTRLSVTSISSSQTAALPASAHQSVIATMQPSTSSPENHTSVNSLILSSPSTLGTSATKLSVEPLTSLSSVTLPLSASDTLPTTKSLLGPSSSALVSFSTSLSAPSVPASSSSPNMATTVSPRRSETPASSPAKTAPDMLAFYLKPLWAESAAQMLEWAEVANERALGESATVEASRSKAIEPQQDSNKILLKGSSVPQEGVRSGEETKEGEKAGETNQSKGQDKIEAAGEDGHKEKDIDERERGGLKEVTNPSVGQKRPREDGVAEVGEDKVTKRIKIIAAHDVPPITPPLPTPSATSQSEAEVEQVVAEQKTKLTGVCDDVSAVDAHPEIARAQGSRDLKPVLADEKAALDNAAPSGNIDLSCVATRQAPRELEPRDPLPSRDEPPLDGPHLDALQQPVLQREPTGALVSSPPAETIDEATAARRRNLEQELSFHVREEQERLRKSQAKRTKKAVEDQAEMSRKVEEELAFKLKQREDELREAMKSRKTERADPQPAPPSVPGQVTVPAPALNAGTIVSLTSSPTAAKISPPRVCHPLPAKPLSRGVALGAAPSGKAVTIPQQVISQDAPQSSKAHPPAKQKQQQPIASTSSSDVPSPVADSSLLPSPLALPITGITTQQTLINVKKEEPATPMIPRVATSAPLKTHVPMTSTDGSKAEQPGQDPPSLMPSSESDVKIPVARSSSEKPNILVKSESSPDQYLEPPTLNRAGKRSRSESLAASVPPVIKKRRESSAPTAELELTYPNADVVSEVSGWGHVEVDVDDEEQRPGRRRRMRTATPDDTDGRGPPVYSTPPPPARSRSRSRTRSRSPLRSTGSRGYPRGPRRGRGRVGWSAPTNRPIERYESRYSPPLRAPSPPRPPRQYNPIETRLYDHYSPPQRGRGRLDQRGPDHYTSHRAYVSGDQRPADSYTDSLSAGPRHNSGFADRRRSPPREHDLYALRRSPPADQNATLPRLPLPRSRSPPRDSRRPPGSSAVRPARYPYPRPTSPLRRTTRTVRESQPEPPRRVRPDGPPAVLPQNMLPPPTRITPPHLHLPQAKSPPREVHRLPPAQPAMANSQYATLSRVEVSRPRDYALGDNTSLSSSLGQLPIHYNDASRLDTLDETARGLGADRPMPGSLPLESDDQRAARQYRPYSRNRQISSGGHDAITKELSTTHERPPHSPTQRSLMNRISPDDLSKANIEPHPRSLGTRNANESTGSRGRGSSHRGGRAGGGRIKLAARLSDAQTGGSLMKRVGPQ